MLTLHKSIFSDFSDLHAAISCSVIHHYRYHVLLISSTTRILKQSVTVTFAEAVVVPFKQHAVLGQVIEAIGRARLERQRVQLLASCKGIHTNAFDATRKDDIFYMVGIFKGTIANVFNAVEHY